MGLVLAYGLVRTLAWLIFTIVMVSVRKERLGNPERGLLISGGGLATLSALAFSFYNAGYHVPVTLVHSAILFSTPAICLVLIGSLFAVKRLGLVD